jgi:hypothetical protein
MKITMEFHASELNAAMLAALNVLLVEDKREEMRGLGADEGVAELPGDGAAFGEVWGVPTDETLTASEMAARADAADARVVGDWTAPRAKAGMAVPCDPVTMEPLPIKRSEVVLQVGDVVEFNDGKTGVVCTVGDHGQQPCWTEGAYCTTRDGIAIGTGGEVARVISVSTRPIIEDN